MNDITYYLAQITPAYWGFILIAGVAVSVTLELTKHVFSNALKDKKKTITGLLSVLSLLATIAQYVLSNQSNLGFLGIYTPAVLGVAVIIHQLAVSPITKQLKEYSATKNQDKSDLANYRALLTTTPTGDQAIAQAEQQFSE